MQGHEDDLFDIFHASELDDAELHQILLSHFHGAAQVSKTEVIFPGDEQTYAVKLLYKKNALAEITPGPSLKPEDIGALRSLVEAELTPAPEEVGTHVLFASLPVRGWFKYRDHFQILPMPSEAPQPLGFLAEHHPFLLQFRFKPSTNTPLSFSRRDAQGQRLTLLLTGLLEGDIHSLARSVQFHWVLPRPELNELPLKLVSAYCQEGYAFPLLGSLSRNEFSSVDELTPVQAAEPEEYYTRFGITPEEGLQVPHNLASLIDRFFSLNETDQDSFLRSCFWLNHANRVFTYSASAFFTSLISALEALIPTEASGDKCPMCQRSISKGSTRRLTELLNQYAPHTPKFNFARAGLYYQRRSTFSHGGELAYSDRKSIFLGVRPKNNVPSESV
jgi:hypothetical protein